MVVRSTSNSEGTDASTSSKGGERPHLRTEQVGWLDPRLELFSGPLGDGMYAKAPIKKGEELLFWSGKIVRGEEMKNRDLTWTLQIEDDFFQVPIVEGEPDKPDLVNHSCSPNAGFGANGALLVAMRDIEAGEEITFDYCMAYTSHIGFNPLKCLCGSPNCRKLITADDWRNPELQAAYGEYFSPYVRRKISRLQQPDTAIGA
eukprot:tig00000248_g21809.t1